MIGPIVSRLEELTEEERRRSYEHERYFHSPHEAFGVIKEEVEETEDELLNMKGLLDAMWYRVKRDETVSGQVAQDLRDCSLRCAAEAVQVAAMCDKLVESGKKWGDL